MPQRATPPLYWSYLKLVVHLDVDPQLEISFPPVLKPGSWYVKDAHLLVVLSQRIAVQAHLHQERFVVGTKHVS